jgi:ABC-type methionine transport system permease subunit
MSANTFSIVFLSTCLIVFLVCSIGIAYFHITGKAQWAEGDKEKTLGCLASYVISVPYIILVFGALKVTQTYISPKLPSSLPPVAGYIIFFAVSLSTALLFNILDKLLIARSEIRRRLHNSMERGNHHQETNNLADWVRQKLK